MQHASRLSIQRQKAVFKLYKRGYTHKQLLLLQAYIDLQHFNRLLYSRLYNNIKDLLRYNRLIITRLDPSGLYTLGKRFFFYYQVQYLNNDASSLYHPSSSSLLFYLSSSGLLGIFFFISNNKRPAKVARFLFTTNAQ